jgi:hypothetical protein
VVMRMLNVSRVWISRELEMIQNVDNELIRARANMFFTRLLDLLAKLDSKASAELSR